MMNANKKARCYLALIFVSLAWSLLSDTAALAQDALPTLEEVKAKGIAQSGYRDFNRVSSVSGKAPEANTKVFHAEIKPLLQEACFQCHGADLQEGGFRLDTLDPDLLHGDDADWWIEVVDVISKIGRRRS